ncbi:MAG: hypothetical protein AAFY45_19255 [Bacteroidota bacterium]
MTRKKAALIGRFDFTSIFALIERLKQAADFFSPNLSFSTYLTTFKGQSYYGMDYAELASVFEEHEGDVRSLTSSCNIGEGKSMSVSVRYPKKGGKAESQFVISSDSTYISKQVQAIFRGEYKIPDEDALWAREYVGELIGNLLSYKEAKAKEAARLAEEAARLLEEEKRKAQENRAKVEKIPGNRSLRTDSLSTIRPVRDRFSFDASFSADLIIEMLSRISEHLLHRAPFHIKVITSNGQPFSNVGFKGLKLFLEKRRKSVRTLMMDAATAQGEWANIVINFESSNACSAEVEIFAKRGKMIQAMIRDFLERTAEVNLKTASMVHEMFLFEQDKFSLDQVSKLISSISSKYLKKEAATAFLSTSEGETYPALTLRQLRSVYNQKKEEVSFLLYGINQSDTGQTFSLMFQFESPVQKAYGSLSMMWGNHETHQVVRALVWEQLGLKNYRKHPPQNGQPEQEAITEKPVSVPLPQERKKISFDPIFKQRDFSFEPLTSLVFMPLEAYWSESLWLHLKDTLRELGYYSRKANSIYSEDSLEINWREINQCELIIADLTYKHPDVFYKVGIAHTLGKNVILITQHARDLPGDFKRFPYIVYDNNIYGLQDLRNNLLSLVRDMRAD